MWTARRTFDRSTYGLFIWIEQRILHGAMLVFDKSCGVALNRLSSTLADGCAFYTHTRLPDPYRTPFLPACFPNATAHPILLRCDLPRHDYHISACLCRTGRNALLFRVTRICSPFYVVHCHDPYYLFQTCYGDTLSNANHFH